MMYKFTSLFIKIIIAVFICSLPLAALADDFIDTVPDFSAEFLEEITGHATLKDVISVIISGDMDFDEGLFARIINLVVGDVRQCMGYILSVIGFCILSSCIKGSQIRLSGSTGDISFLVCYCISAGFLLGILRIASDIAFGASEDIVTFIRMSLPAYIGVITSTGVNAAASEGIFLAMINVISRYAGSFMINAFFYIGVLTIVSNMSEEIHISKLIHIFSQVLFWILGFLLTVFAGMTALSGLNASAASGTGIRAVKYTIGHAVPVVGGFLADSTELILASAKIFKSAFGTAGIIILTIACMIPVIKLFIIGFLLKIAAGLTEPFCNKLICDTIYAIGHTVIHIMVSVILMTVMFILAFAVLLNL